MQMGECVYQFSMRLAMIPWDMKAVLRDGVLYRVWRKSCFQSSVCWPVSWIYLYINFQPYQVTVARNLCKRISKLFFIFFYLGVSFNLVSVVENILVRYALQCSFPFFETQLIFVCLNYVFLKTSLIWKWTLILKEEIPLIQYSPFNCIGSDRAFSTQLSDENFNRMYKKHLLKS